MHEDSNIWVWERKVATSWLDNQYLKRIHIQDTSLTFNVQGISVVYLWSQIRTPAARKSVHLNSHTDWNTCRCKHMTVSKGTSSTSAVFVIQHIHKHGHMWSSCRCDNNRILNQIVLDVLYIHVCYIHVFSMDTHTHTRLISHVATQSRISQCYKCFFSKCIYCYMQRLKLEGEIVS